MRYRHFDRMDRDVAEINVGTWGLGGDGYGETNDEDAVQAIRAMLDCGVNAIDTAPAYGDGHAETLVGRAIAGYDREKIIVATKCGIMNHTLKAKRGAAGEVRDASFGNILYECEKSLRRLNTDYIDILYVHWPDYDTPLEETAEAFNVLKAEGKIRHIGLSNFSREQIEEISKYCRVDALQLPYSMIVREKEELMRWASAQGIDTFTYGSLGSGILSGKYRTLPEFGPRDPRAMGFYPYFREPGFSKVMELLKVLDEVAEETGRPVIEVSLNWTVSKPFVSTVLCGVRNAAQAEGLVRAFEWELTEAQIAKIDAAIGRYIDFDGGNGMK